MRDNGNWKRQSLQRLVGNKAYGMPLAIRRGDIGIIGNGMARDFVPMVMENVVTVILVVRMDQSMFLLGHALVLAEEV